VSTFEVKNNKILNVEPQALTLLTEQAMTDIAHLLRPAHLQVCSFMFFYLLAEDWYTKTATKRPF